MGGRGGSGGYGNAEERTLLNTSPIMRLKYRDLKEGSNRPRAIDGTYDKDTKTIDANVGRGIHAIMDIMPNDPAEYGKYIYGEGEQVKAKYGAAVDFYNATLVYGEIAEKNVPKWVRKAERLVRQADKLDSKYGINHSTDLGLYHKLKKKGY